MSNQRPSFAKRDREMKLKDKARAKIERRSAKRAGKIAPQGLPVAAETEGAGDIPAAGSPAAPLVTLASAAE